MILITAILGIVFYFNIQNGDEEILLEDGTQKRGSNQDLSNNTSDEGTNSERPTEGVSTYIGMSIESLEENLGQPNRVDQTYYGFDWWIYNTDPANYSQIGVKDGKVVTVYAIGSEVNISPFKIGQHVDEIFSSSYVETEIGLDYEGSSYQFELSESDLNTRPLLKMGDIFVQLYIDKFTATLSSFRVMDAETLLKLRPYELVYFGDLQEIEPDEMAPDEKVEDANEKQIYDITNIMRMRFGLATLQWDEKTATVAYGHSKDMEESNTFSHTSEKFGELSDRLEAGEVFYQVAGENIAANYADAPAVMEGWLNSKGHRESLLNEDFTHIGVGVYKKYYTQNFIQAWEE